MPAGERENPIEDQFSNPFKSRAEFLAVQKEALKTSQRSTNIRGFAGAREALANTTPAEPGTSATQAEVSATDTPSSDT